MKQCMMCPNQLKGYQNTYCSRSCYFLRKRQKQEQQQAKKDCGTICAQNIEIPHKQNLLDNPVIGLIKASLKLVAVAFLVTAILIISLIINHSLFLILIAVIAAYFVLKLLTDL